jgi:hypothetical protein
MSKQQQFEDIVKASLLNKAEKISPSDNMFKNIKYEIQLNRSEKKFMLKEKFLPLNLNLKKSIITAACGTFIILGSVLAFSPNARVSALQSIGKHVNGYIDMKTYDKAPSKDELKKDLGYEVKMPASLPGEYKLMNSSIDGHIDGSTPDKQYDKKEAEGIYSKTNTRQDSLTLGAWKAGARADSAIYKNAKTVTIENTTAYWTEYTVHVLPNDIKLSKEQEAKENEACKSGKEILIGIGSKDGKKLKEEFNTAHSLKWTQNNVNYELTDQNNKLTFDQMSKMAESIINSK